VDYFFYCRDKADTAAVRKQLVKTYWSFVDDYTARIGGSAGEADPALQLAS